MGQRAGWTPAQGVHACRAVTAGWGRRRTPGTQRPTTPAARTDDGPPDNSTEGTSGAGPHRGVAEGRGGKPQAPPPPPHPRHGPPPRRPGAPSSHVGTGRHARALARADRRGVATRAKAQGPSPPPTQERHGYDGRPAAASRVPTRAQVSSAEPGGRGTRQGVGGGRRPPLDHTQRHRRTGGARKRRRARSGAAAGPGKRDAPGRRSGGRQMGTRQTGGQTDERERGGRTWERPASREMPQRDGGGGGGRRPPTRWGGATGTIPKNQMRVGCQGTTRGLTARGLQHNGGPAATPRTPTGLPLNPWGPPPRGGPTTATDDTDEPQPAPWKQVSQGTYRRPPPTPHTHPPCPTLFPHPPAHRGTPEKHITQGHPPGHGGQGVTPTRGEAISGPRLTRGREGERHGTGKAGRSPVRGRGRAGSTGEGRQCTRGKGCEAGTRVPAQGEEKGPRHARQTSTGSHHHTHEGSPMTPGTPGGLSRPRALHDPAPPPGPHVQRLPPPCHVGGGGSSASSHPSVHLSTLISSVLHLVHPPGPDAWGKRS